MAKILTDVAFEAAEQHAHDMRKRLDAMVERLLKDGLSEEQARGSVMAAETFLAQINGELGEYLALQAGLIREVDREHLRTAVVWCRIASGKTQEEFAAIRQVPVARVQRDERNEYYTMSEENALRLIGLLGYEVKAVTRYQLVRK
jgi:hypothetical protein